MISSKKENSPQNLRYSWKNLPLYICLSLAIIIIILDQISKSYFQVILHDHRSIHLFGTHFFQFVLVYNSGAAFSIANGQTWLISIVAFIIVILIVKVVPRMQSVWYVIGFGLILGGAIGNLIDRIFRAPGFLRGEVIDFISIGIWPVFNLADSAICIGAVCIVCTNVFSRKQQKSAVRDEKSAAEISIETATETM